MSSLGPGSSPVLRTLGFRLGENWLLTGELPCKRRILGLFGHGCARMHVDILTPFLSVPSKGPKLVAL
jgi:hypothetical protein